jgi:hypothetical protein
MTRHLQPALEARLSGIEAILAWHPDARREDLFAPGPVC